MDYDMFGRPKNNSAVFWILGIGGLLVAGLIGLECSAATTGLNKETASKEARAWADEMGYTVKGVSCSSKDSDGDGYVSCSVNTEKDGMVPVECIGAYSFGSGCRPMKFINPAVNQQ